MRYKKSTQLSFCTTYQVYFPLLYEWDFLTPILNFSPQIDDSYSLSLSTILSSTFQCLYLSDSIPPEFLESALKLLISMTQDYYRILSAISWTCCSLRKDCQQMSYLTPLSSVFHSSDVWKDSVYLFLEQKDQGVNEYKVIYIKSISPIYGFWWNAINLSFPPKCLKTSSRGSWVLLFDKYQIKSILRLAFMPFGRNFFYSSLFIYVLARIKYCNLS